MSLKGLVCVLNNEHRIVRTNKHNRNESAERVKYIHNLSIASSFKTTSEAKPGPIVLAYIARPTALFEIFTVLC